MGIINKLPDDMLDQVSGGTNGEMIDLQTKLGASNIKEIVKGLKERGINVELSSENKNIYTDASTKKALSHEDVLAILKRR